MPFKSKITIGKISLPSNSEFSKPERRDDDEEKQGTGFGSFEPSRVEKDEEEMRKVMGFTDFKTPKSAAITSTTKGKSARSFNVEEMVEAIKASKHENEADKISVDFDSEQHCNDEEEDESNEVVGPMPSHQWGSSSKTKEKEVNSDSDEELSDEDEPSLVFPTSHKFDLSHGDRPVTSLSIDYTGTRFATGSLDYDVQLWDFTGLKNRHCFRTLRPCESHPILSLSYSMGGNALLVISGSAQAKVLNRDGSELMECKKGDQYIVDMAQTTGHVAALTGGEFNPKKKHEFITSSDDGTCRLWDVNEGKNHVNCVKMKSSAGLKNKATTCTFSRDGNCFMGAGIDGSILMWDTRKPMVVPNATIRNAHQKNTQTFCISYSYSSLKVASRGEDSVVNIWDTRNLKKILFKDTDKGAKYIGSNLSWSPDDSHLLIPALPPGTTGRSKDESITHSSLYFLKINDLSYSDEYKIPKEIIINTSWHHKLNQISMTFGSGKVSFLYDLQRSKKGALLAHGKAPKKPKKMEIVEDLSGKVVITPNSLPLFKADKPKNPKRDEMKARQDPVRSKRPDLPIATGSGGRVASAGSTLSSYVIRNLGLQHNARDPRGQDPREALLKYAKEAEENPIWVAPAYKKTQPKIIFSEETDNDSDAPPKKQKLA